MSLKSDNKEQNIAEIIIQIYKNEDLVRAFDFDLEKIGNHVINHLPISNIDKLQQVNFYEDLIVKMKTQKIEKFGHLEEAVQLVSILEKLNASLKKNDIEYQKIYAKSLVHIKKNIDLSEHKITSEIQICLNGIYGFLLLKLSGKNLDDENKLSIEAFGDLLSYLSFKHAEIKAAN